VGALSKQQDRFHAFFRLKAREEQVHTNLRFTTPKRPPRPKTPKDGDPSKRPTPQATRRLQVHFLLEGRDLRCRDRPGVFGLHFCKRSRSALPLDMHVLRVVALTFPFLSPHGNLRAPPSNNGADPLSSLPRSHQTRHYLTSKRWGGARVLPFVDDFLFFAS
jgi:hypothetical protein